MALGVSRLTLLGYALLAWGGVVALAAAAVTEGRLHWILLVGSLLAATGGLATAIVGAALHESI